MSEKRHRLFFALNPPSATRAALAALQRRLAVDARPVRPRQFHITLAFLGQVPAASVDLALAIGHELSFSGERLALDRVGWFRRTRVGWVGCRALPVRLIGFQGELARRLGRAGLRRERRDWTPHVTLYREMRKPFGKISFRPIEWDVNSFSLVESQTLPEGARYRVLARWERRRRRN